MISPSLRKKVKGNGMCRGEYTRMSGSEVVRTGNCGREGKVVAHIKHSGMGHSKSRDMLENLLWLCPLHHEFMDERISPREYNRLRTGL